MNLTIKRMLCLLMASVCIFTALPAMTLRANAESVYQLTELLEQGKIKPLGRTQTNLAGTGILTDWPGSGFQMNVSGNGGQLKVAIHSNYTSNWAVLVDDEQVFWNRLVTTAPITATIPAGNHTVTVIKESDAWNEETSYCEMTSVDIGDYIP